MSKTWREHCSGATDTYGSQYKYASNKNSGPAKLANILPSGSKVTVKETLHRFLDSLYITDSTTPHTVSAKDKQGDPIPPVVTKAELTE